LQGFTALHGRAEALSGTAAAAAGFDAVTARALGSLPLLVRLAAPWLAPGGRLLAMKGGEGRRELAESERQLLSDGWTMQCHDLVLPVSGALRCLIILEHNM